MDDGVRAIDRRLRVTLPQVRDYLRLDAFYLVLSVEYDIELLLRGVVGGDGVHSHSSLKPSEGLKPTPPCLRRDPGGMRPVAGGRTGPASSTAAGWWTSRLFVGADPGGLRAVRN